MNYSQELKKNCANMKAIYNVKNPIHESLKNASCQLLLSFFGETTCLNTNAVIQETRVYLSKASYMNRIRRTVRGLLNS